MMVDSDRVSRRCCCEGYIQRVDVDSEHTMDSSSSSGHPPLDLPRSRPPPSLLSPTPRLHISAFALTASRRPGQPPHTLLTAGLLCALLQRSSLRLSHPPQLSAQHLSPTLISTPALTAAAAAAAAHLQAAACVSCIRLPLAFSLVLLPPPSAPPRVRCCDESPQVRAAPPREPRFPPPQEDEAPQGKEYDAHTHSLARSHTRWHIAQRSAHPPLFSLSLQYEASLAMTRPRRPTSPPSWATRPA